jgi:hypothetical protein
MGLGEKKSLVNGKYFILRSVIIRALFQIPVKGKAIPVTGGGGP